MNRIVLIAVAIGMFAVVATDAKGMPAHFSVWKDDRGLFDDSLVFLNFTQFIKIGGLLKDALKAIESPLDAEYILTVMKGKLPRKDVPVDRPKLTDDLYHFFFLVKNIHHGAYYLPVAVTIGGRGWTKAKPSLFIQDEHIMEATYRTLEREFFDEVADFWEGYLDTAFKKFREPV